MNNILLFELPEPWDEISQVGFRAIFGLIDAPYDEPHGLFVRQADDGSFDVEYLPRDTPSASIEVKRSEETYLSGTDMRISITVSPTKTTGKAELMAALYSNRIHIFHLEVGKEVRRSNLGHLLLDASLAVAKLTKKERISMKFKNDGGESFLLKYGFKKRHIDTKHCSGYNHESVIVGAATKEELQKRECVEEGPIVSSQKKTPIHQEITGVETNEVNAPKYRVFGFCPARSRDQT
ncbi:MAG: hypothetical protein ACQEP0_08400 [Natrinema limicola]